MIKSLFDEDKKTMPDKPAELPQIEKIGEITADKAEDKTTEPHEQEIDDKEVFASYIPSGDVIYSDFSPSYPAETINSEDGDTTNSDTGDKMPQTSFHLSESYKQTGEKVSDEFDTNSSTLFQTRIKPESTAETARKSGLAMSASIALFGSVVFMLIIGWVADLLLGTSPWGIITGIVIGSAIGFLQFFKMTSSILKNKE